MRLWGWWDMSSFIKGVFKITSARWLNTFLLLPLSSKTIIQHPSGRKVPLWQLWDPSWLWNLSPVPDQGEIFCKGSPESRVLTSLVTDLKQLHIWGLSCSTIWLWFCHQHCSLSDPEGVTPTRAFYNRYSDLSLAVDSEVAYEQGLASLACNLGILAYIPPNSVKL